MNGFCSVTFVLALFVVAMSIGNVRAACVMRFCVYAGMMVPSWIVLRAGLSESIGVVLSVPWMMVELLTSWM